jgi:hypothetical protein
MMSYKRAKTVSGAEFVQSGDEDNTFDEDYEEDDGEFGGL